MEYDLPPTPFQPWRVEKELEVVDKPQFGLCNLRSPFLYGLQMGGNIVQLFSISHKSLLSTYTQ